jgi:hypothetical protein
MGALCPLRVRVFGVAVINPLPTALFKILPTPYLKVPTTTSSVPSVLRKVHLIGQALTPPALYAIA